MKIHKINLENFYRNLMLESLKLRGSIASYTPNPEYTEVVVKCNVNDTLTVGIPSLPASVIQTQTASGMWSVPVTIQYATATIVGLTSNNSIPLGTFSLEQDGNKLYWRDSTDEATPTLNLYTIPTTVNKLKVVISFKSGCMVKKKVGNRIKDVWEDLIANDSIEALTVNVKWEVPSANSPVTLLTVDSVEMNNLVARVEALEEAANAENTPAAGEE